MINHINLNLLRSLQVLLEECHVSRAAQRLNITQSAVSRQLAQLRTLCDDPLLVRNGNVLVATPRAQVLLSRVNSLLTQADELFSDIPFAPDIWQQEFVFSSSDYVAQFIVPEVVSLLSQQAPLVDLTYRLWQPDYLTQIQSTGIDLASTMLAQPPEQLSSILIGQDNSVCLMREHHPLMAKSLWCSDDIVGFPHLKVTGGGDKDSHADFALSALGLKRRIAVKVPFFSAAVNALQSSDLLMIVPEHIAINLAKQAPLSYRSLPFETTAHLYWLMWHPKFDQDKAHTWMRNNVLQVMQHSPFSIGMI
ncbi:LysR family transcriptional regulator [Vibrio scophthalmi]|uniref:Transcriptional regulator n=2 Tax=Vibrio scophthalmi TaxID=45658 RepID=F9RQ45_9VIBR|nr:LysR family transcriptional regulator [Vibrio scophthalmi]ANU38662.1 Nodulation protein D [Vibrio scophthalmi]EGU34647.1 transcriptional regulator [Vibrio scophthalmi LMG 19158]